MRPRRKRKRARERGKRKPPPLTWDTAWAIGRFDLGLSEEEFWSLSPKKFFLLLDRLQRREREHEWLAHRIVATIVNVNIDPKKRKTPYQAEYFMRQYKKEPDAKAFQKRMMAQTESQKIEKWRKGVTE